MACDTYWQNKSTIRLIKSKPDDAPYFCIQGRLRPCFPCLVMDRDSKSRISRSSDLRRPYLSSFFPSRTISCTLRTVKENGPETSRLQRRHRTGFTPVSLFTGPTFLLADTHSVRYITYFPFSCQASNIVNPCQFLPFLRGTIKQKAPG